MACSGQHHSVPVAPGYPSADHLGNLALLPAHDPNAFGSKIIVAFEGCIAADNAADTLFLEPASEFRVLVRVPYPDGDVPNVPGIGSDFRNEVDLLNPYGRPDKLSIVGNRYHRKALFFIGSCGHVFSIPITVPCLRDCEFY